MYSKDLRLEFFGFHQHVHQVQEDEKAEDKQSGIHTGPPLYLLEPVDAFEKKIVTQASQASKQCEQQNFIHGIKGFMFYTHFHAQGVPKISGKEQDFGY